MQLANEETSASRTTDNCKYNWCFFVLGKLLLDDYCDVVWALFIVFSYLLYYVIW